MKSPQTCNLPIHLSPLHSYQVMQGQLESCEQFWKTEDRRIISPCVAGYALGNDKTCGSVGTKYFYSSFYGTHHICTTFRKCCCVAVPL